MIQNLPVNSGLRPSGKIKLSSRALLAIMIAIGGVAGGTLVIEHSITGVPFSKLMNIAPNSSMLPLAHP